MINYDWIIDKINPGGGVSVLFENLHSYVVDNASLPVSDFVYDHGRQGDVVPTRMLERYRDFVFPCGADAQGVFHSTYYRIPKDRSVKVVTTVHDFTYERVLTGAKRYAHSYQKNHAILNSDIVICVSKNTADDLLHYVPTIDPSKVQVVHNGVSDIYSAGDQDATFSDCVLFVGARGRYKNFFSAVQAVAAMDGRKSLVCIGGGAFTRSEVSLMNRVLGRSRYRHAGYISTLELRDYYRSSYCLLYPSLYEGFGIPLLEAFACGCPVVAVDTSSIPEVSGGAALLAESGDPLSLSIQLGRLSDSVLRRELIDKGFERSKMFSWERTSKETVALYNHLLDL